jgi:ABC-type nitrate/sulfonate/bicarbonate transport system substrate-binding protein
LLSAGQVDAACLPQPLGEIAAFLKALNEGQQLADTDRRVVETVAGCPIFL